MKRRLLIAAIFLLAGSVVNVAVAWGIVAGADLNAFRDIMSGSSVKADWPRDAPSHWPVSCRVRGPLRGIGWQAWFWVAGRTQHGQEEARGESFTIMIASAGWPCRATQWELWGDLLVNLRGAKPRLGGVPDDKWWRNGVEIQMRQFGLNLTGWKRLPLRPLWLGFVANTSFYAVVLWSLIRGPFVLHRIIRVKRGLCPACAYPMGEALVCTECGKALPVRARATA